MKTLKEIFWSKVSIKSENECWEWLMSKDKCGYGRLMFNSIREKAHRISWKLINGEIPDGLYVCHKCDNPSCVNPKHLFLGTQKDNMVDMRKKNRQPSVLGEKNPKAKLTEEIVLEIRLLYQFGIRQYEIAKMYKISRFLVFDIVHRRKWKHV